MKCSWKIYTLFLCGSVMVGCGESSDSAVSDSNSTSAPAPAAAASVEAPADATPSDPLLKDIEFDDPQEFPQAVSAYEANPKDAAAVQKYAEVLLSMAWAHAQGGNAELSDQSLSRAGQLILKANEAGVALPPTSESSLQIEILFGYACVLSKQEKGAESLQTLEKAMAAGFSNLNVIKSDADLAFTRSLPEFAPKLAEWEAAYDAELVAAAKADLANGVTFPFDFQLNDVNGELIKLSDYKAGSPKNEKGQVCVVDIWGTWCPPCRQEVPSFVKLQEQYGKFGFMMIGLNDEKGSTPEANNSIVQNFMANMSMNYPCALLTPEVSAQVPELNAFPTTLFIDHHGKVRLMAKGYHEYKYMDTVVRALLSEQSLEYQNAATN